MKLCYVLVHDSMNKKNCDKCLILRALLWMERGAGIATGYGLNGRGVVVRVPVRVRFLSSPRRPDRFWGQLRLLANGYRGLFPRG
jgi:hypothetical protein